MDDEANAGRRGVLILVVEADRYIRALQQTLLCDHHAVYFVSDGEAALAAARALRPVLLIADILVPKIDGLRVCHDDYIRALAIGDHGVAVGDAPPGGLP